MATLTPLLSLVKPAGSDAAAISVLNGNMDILDQALTLTGSQTASGKTLTAPHMTGPIVDAGGLTVTSGGETITAGGLTVTAGNVGIGAAPVATVGLAITSSALTGTTQYGIYSSPIGSSAATSGVDGFLAAPATAAAAFTSTQVTGFHALSPSKGGGSTITSAYGLLIDPITSGNTNNYGISIGAPSGGSGNNIGLVNSGTTSLAGRVGIGSNPHATDMLSLTVAVSATATAGGGAAIPATVRRFLRVYDGTSGESVLIPCYLP